MCELDHRDAFELLAATILSAQSTDVRVNMVTPALFARYPTPADLAAADPEELEEIIRTTGFYRTKTKSLIGMATGVTERFGGEVPSQDVRPGVAARRRSQDRQRGAQRGPRPARACRSTPTSCGCPSGSASPTETDPVKVELELNPMVPWPNEGTSAFG